MEEQTQGSSLSSETCHAAYCSLQEHLVGFKPDYKDIESDGKSVQDLHEENAAFWRFVRADPRRCQFCGILSCYGECQDSYFDDWSSDEVGADGEVCLY